MGFITELANSSRKPTSGREMWDRVFVPTHITNKEERFNQPTPKVVPGGSWTMGVSSNENAYRRLLEAYRSRAPGNWSADRYEQSNHFVGIGYVAIHRICEQLSQAEFTVYSKDPSHPDGMRPVKRGEPGYRLIELLEKPNNDDGFGDLMYCFPAGTRVRMATGEQRVIEDVQIGDLVLTAEGNVHPVEKLHIHEHQTGLVKLRLWGHSHLRMTPNHPVLTRNGYVPAGDLKKGDWVKLPRFSSSERIESIQTEKYVKEEESEVTTARGGPVRKPSTEGTAWANYKKLPDVVKLTAGFGRLLGYYMAEGYAAKNACTGYLSFSANEKDTLVADVVKLFREELGIEATVILANKKKSVALVRFHSKLAVRLFRTLCGHGASEKRVHPDLFAAPDDFLLNFLEGWLQGDGHARRKGIEGATVSRNLALGVFDIANHLGLKPFIRDGGRPKQTKVYDSIGYQIKNNHNVWFVGFGSDESQRFAQTDEGATWRRVRDVQNEDFIGTVYNIGVGVDNSYVAEGIAVHNCYGLQMSLTGTSLFWMVPSLLPSAIEGRGTPMELYPIPTAVAVPQAVASPEFPDGYYRIQPVYPYGPFSTSPTPNSAVGAAIPAEWVLKTKYPHPLLRYDGWSPQSALKFHLDLVEMIDRSRHYTMRRTVNPCAQLISDDAEGAQPLPDEELERIKAEFEEAFMGPENSGRLFVGAPGYRLDQWGSRPVDMDYPNGWNQLVSFVLGGFGITKQASGMVEDSSYSTLFATLKQLYWLTLEPLCNRFARQLTRHLAPFFGPDLVVDIRCKRIDDHEVMLAKNNFLMTARALTKNEARKSMDYPLTREPWGDDVAGVEPMQLDANGMPIPLQPTQASAYPGMAAEVEEGPGQDLSEAMRILPAEISTSRPDPAGLNTGAMGDRKVPGAPRGGEGKNLTKSLYQKVQEVMRNGH